MIRKFYGLFVIYKKKLVFASVLFVSLFHFRIAEVIQKAPKININEYLNQRNKI